MNFAVSSASERIRTETLLQGAHAFLRNENKTFIRPQLERNKTFYSRKSMILTDEKNN